MGLAQVGMFFRGEFSNAYTLRAPLTWGNGGYHADGAGIRQPADALLPAAPGAPGV